MNILISMLIGDLTNVNNQNPLIIHKIVSSYLLLYFIRNANK